MKLIRILPIFTLALSPALALAHPGHAHGPADSALLAGISHPLLGIDHLLAMLAVGLWAAQQRGTAAWALPVTFVASMLLGGLLGFAGVGMPMLESAIAASVIALGLMVCLAARPALPVALGLVALFAVAHGIAHGQELPAMAGQWTYATGFVAATAALHTFGYAVAHLLPRAAQPLVRLSGALSAGAGLWLLAA